MSKGNVWNWTEEDLAAYLARFNRAALPTADVESNSVNGYAAKNVDKEIRPRIRVHIHSKRRRLCDPDGISCKWALDGIVKAGLLIDDSAKHINEVTFSQELSEQEETIIELWQIE